MFKQDRAEMWPAMYGNAAAKAYDYERKGDRSFQERFHNTAAMWYFHEFLTPEDFISLEHKYVDSLHPKSGVYVMVPDTHVLYSPWAVMLGNNESSLPVGMGMHNSFRTHAVTGDNSDYPVTEAKDFWRMFDPFLPDGGYDNMLSVMPVWLILGRTRKRLIGIDNLGVMGGDLYLRGKYAMTDGFSISWAQQMKNLRGI